MSAHEVSDRELIMCVGDTTYLDYGIIKVKRDGYGSQCNGGNGLLLHSGLAVCPENGQPLGLLWQKRWNREHRAQAPSDETPSQKKKRQVKARSAKRERPFAEQESYRWVEAMDQTQTSVKVTTRLIHSFDREGDIALTFPAKKAWGATMVLSLRTLSYTGGRWQQFWSKINRYGFSI